MASRSTDRRQDGIYFGWRVVLACFFIAFFAWGLAFYGHAVYLPQLRQLHGWSISLVSGATTVSYLFGAVLLIWLGDTVERFGPRAVVLTGMALLGGSVLAVGFVERPWQLYLAYLVMAAGWVTMSTAAINIIIAPWFVRRRGLAISLALNGASSGGILVAPALVWMAEGYGLTAAVAGAVAAMAFVLLPLVLMFVRRRPQDLGLLPDGDAAPAGQDRASAEPGPQGPRWRRQDAMRDLGFWTIAAPFALGLTAQVGFLTHEIAFLEPMLGPRRAGIALALTTVAAVVGRVGLGLVIDRLDQRAVSAASLVSQAAALALLIVADQPGLLYLGCIVYGLSVGNLITLPGLIVQREFAAAAFGSIVGLVTAVSQFTYAFGPGLLGLVRDLAGSYGPALALCILLKLAGAAILLAGRHRRSRGPQLSSRLGS